MPEFKELITQVSGNTNTSEQIKKETSQLLYDAQGIISLAEKKSKEKWDEVSKKYENLKNQIIEALKSNNDITVEELKGLKEQIETTHDKMANFYVINPKIFRLETNKDIVIKTLNKLVNQKKENQKNLTDTTNLTVDINLINLSLRMDLDVIKATRPEWMTLFPEDILNIPDDFFKDEKNIENILKITNKNDKNLVIIKASKIINEDLLINLIWKINKSDLEIDKILDKDIPINLLSKDKNNIMWLNKEWKEKHFKKIDEITIDAMDKILDNGILGRDLAYEVEYYLQKYSINDLSDEKIVTILTNLNDADCLKYAPKLLISLDKKINIVNDFIKNKDHWFIKNLPTELRKNNEIQKNYIDVIRNYASINSDTSFLLDYLEFDDLEIVKYFYINIKSLWEEISNEIFSDFKLRDNIRIIIWNNKNSNDEIINEMVKKFYDIHNWWNELIKAVIENKTTFDEIQNDNKHKDIFSKHLKKELTLNESDEKINELVNKIINLKNDDLWKLESKLLYKELLKICWTPEKVTKFIEKVKGYEITELVKESDKIKKELEEQKFENFNINLDKVESDFDGFLVNKIKDFKEKNKNKPINIENISKEAIEEYIKNNKKENITLKEEEKIRNILNNFITRRETKSELDNIDSYSKTLAWDMKKEDYNKIIENSLEQKYDFKAEQEIVEKNLQIEKDYNYKTWLFNPTEDNYINTNWWYNLIGKDWEIVKWLVISEKEKNLTLWNPEATENLISFYSFFKKLNLESVWIYREELFKAIWNIFINPDDANFMKESEIINFSNKILTFIENIENKWEKKNISINSISAVNKKLEEYSKSGLILNDNQTFNLNWDDRFGALLRQYWIIWWAYFRTYEFRKYV